VNNSSCNNDVEEDERKKIKRSSFYFQEGEDNNKNDQSESTVAENSESSQKMLEMEWNIESSTLQLNGDEQHEEKIIQVEVPIQQQVSANKGDANSIVEVQSPATLLETGADNNVNNSANMRHQWPTSLVQLIDLLKDEKNTQSDSSPISATAFIPTTTSTNTP
jgi:hypothetical protein